MAQNYVYPIAAEMSEILPDLITKGAEGRVGLSIFPPVNKSSFMVRWIQDDAGFGLMHFRGLDGAPPRVQRLGTNTFTYEPGVYGEYQVITEREMLTRAAPMRPDLPIPVGDLVMKATNQIIGRRYDRMEYNVWQLLGTGTLTIPLPGPNGVSAYTDTYPIQTQTAAIPFATTATATPILEFQKIQQKQLGHSVDFGAGATAYMNQVTANRILNNGNSADFGGRRDQYGATLNALPQFNSYFAAQNLPKIVVVDDGYQPFPVSGVEINPSLQFQKFIPDGTIIVVGKRPGGANVGEWQQTINAMNPGNAPGPYGFVKDYANGINTGKEVAPKIEIHGGVNGGPAILYPSAIVVLTA